MCYLEELFGHVTPEQRAAIEADKAHRDALLSAPRAPAVSTPCPKCMGSGRIAQFSHRKGGECFTCGGTGVFAGYRA